MYCYFTFLRSSRFYKACLVVLLLISPNLTQAASLLVTPQAGSFTVESVFSVNIIVNSSDAAFNAVSGKLSFPSDLVEVVSVSKSQSIVSLWVQEPNFSNTAGSVSFEGVVLNPGYKGSAGKILTVNFRVKKNGDAKLTFLNGEILANDGVGTSILSSLGKASYTFLPVPIYEDTLPDKEVEKELDTEVVNTNNEATSSEAIISTNASSSIDTNVVENNKMVGISQGVLEENLPFLNTNREATNALEKIIILLSLVIPALALATLLGILIFYIWKFFGGVKKSIKKEIDEAKLITQKAFILLRENLEQDVETLQKASEKRKLTKEEAKILKRLRKNIDEAEKVICKEISDVNDELDKYT